MLIKQCSKSPRRPQSTARLAAVTTIVYHARGGNVYDARSGIAYALEESRRETTTEIFDRIAPGWYDFRHWSIFRAELEVLAKRWRRGRLINLGCAHGADFLPFVTDFDLNGVDFSAEMLRQAGRYQSKFGFSAGLVRADVGCLPFADE